MEPTLKVTLVMLNTMIASFCLIIFDDIETFAWRVGDDPTGVAVTGVGAICSAGVEGVARSPIDVAFPEALMDSELRVVEISDDWWVG